MSGFLGLEVERGLTVNGDGCTFDKLKKNGWMIHFKWGNCTSTKLFSEKAWSLDQQHQQPLEACGIYSSLGPPLPPLSLFHEPSRGFWCMLQSESYQITEIFRRNNQLDVAIKRECGFRKRTVPKAKHPGGLGVRRPGCLVMAPRWDWEPKTDLVVHSKRCAVPVGPPAGGLADSVCRRLQRPLVTDIYRIHKELPKELDFWHGKKETRGLRSPLRESKLGFWNLTSQVWRVRGGWF